MKALPTMMLFLLGLKRKVYSGKLTMIIGAGLAPALIRAAPTVIKELFLRFPEFLLHL